MELVVSVQTDLLDSDPELTITSSLPATDVRRLLAADGSQFATVAADARPGARDFTSPPGCFLFRISPQTSYLEMVHPSDFRQMAITSPTGTAEKLFGVQTRLFAERLEKGVILRSRLRGWFLAREADETAAVQLYREFCATEPPLTA